MDPWSARCAARDGVRGVRTAAARARRHGLLVALFVLVTMTISPASGSARDDDTAGLLFDATQGDLLSHFDNSGNAGLVEDGQRAEVVASPVDASRDALSFRLDGGGKRSEVLPEGPGTEPQDGDEQWVRYAAVLDRDFPTDTESWQLILQWHHRSPNGSPPLALQVSGGQLLMVSGGDDKQAIGAAAPGDTIDLTMHIVFSQDPRSSSVTVLRDGQPTGVTDWSPRAGTMSTQEAYLKMGLYRDPRIDTPAEVTVTDLKIGQSPDAVGAGASRDGEGPDAGQESSDAPTAPDDTTPASDSPGDTTAATDSSDDTAADDTDSPRAAPGAADSPAADGAADPPAP